MAISMKPLMWITLTLLSFRSFSQEPSFVSWKKEALIWTGIGLSHWYVQTEFRSMQPPKGVLESPENSLSINNWSRKQYSGRMDVGSDILLSSLMVAGVIWRSPVFSENTSANLWLSEMLTYGEALAISSILNLWVRSASYSPRPLAYNPDAPDSYRSNGEIMGSFYSGHSSAAFLTAVYFGNILNKKHPGSKWTKIIYAGGVFAGAVVSYMRMEAGKHYLADVAAGAVAGSLFAWGYPLIKEGGVEPKINLSSKSLGLCWNRYF